MKLKSKFCIAALMALLVSGCAYTNSTIKIDYTPSNFKPVTSAKATVKVEQLTDQRGVEPNLLSYKGVQMRTSGRYLCDKEVSVVVTDAIKALLKDLGYSVLEDGGDYRLSGELLKFDSTVAVGFWSGQLDGIIQVNLRVKDSDKGTVIWNEMLSGTAKKTGLQFDGEAHRKEVAENAIDSLMHKIAESSSLRKALETTAE